MYFKSLIGTTNRRTTVVGKILLVSVSDDTGNNPSHIRFADLEKNTEIKEQLTLEPIFNVDLSGVADVSRTPSILEVFSAKKLKDTRF